MPLLASRSFRGAMKVVFITVPTYNTAVVLCPRTNALCGIGLRDSLLVYLCGVNILSRHK